MPDTEACRLAQSLRRDFEAAFAPKFADRTSIKTAFSVACVCRSTKNKQISFSDGKTRTFANFVDFFVLVKQHRDTQQLFVLGIEAFLAVDGQRRMLFVKNVDSTGLMTPRVHQSKLTKQLLTTMMNTLQATECSLFVAPKPSLIFAESQRNPRKTPLDGAALFGWWLGVVKPLFDRIAVFAPAGDESRLMRGLEASAVAWRLPFDGEPFPLIDGDVKSVHFTSFFKDVARRQQQNGSGFNFAHFFESMAVREEFSNGFGCFLRCFKEAAVCFDAPTDALFTEVAAGAFEKMRDAFSGLSFEGEALAATSTAEVAALLPAHAFLPFEAAFGAEEDATPNSAAKRHRAASDAAPRSVQSLVRRCRQPPTQ